MSKILLINPPLGLHELYKRGSEKTASIIPPLGLAYIAAALERDGHEVEIIDGIASRISLEETAKKSLDFDFVGITVLSAFFKRCAELIKAIKGLVNIPIIAGGAHATALPASLLEEGADFIVMGEGEETVVELIKALGSKEKGNFDNIKGIAFLKDGKLAVTPRRPLIKNLDTLPMPARHLLPMDKYKTSEGRTYRNPSHSMVVSRGCPGNCSFCYKGIFGTDFRCNSPERIFREMSVLKDTYKAEEISFMDDSLTTGRDTVISLCDMLIREKFNLPWSCEGRIDSVDGDMLKIMKRAGCEFIAYGIESGNDEVLKKINKRLNTSMIRSVVDMTKKTGISVRGYFMLGFIGETMENMRQTIRFASSLGLDTASFSLLVPFPGTSDYVRAKDEAGNFDPEFFRKKILPEFNFPDEPVYAPIDTDAKSLINIHRMAYRSFYCRPSFIIRQLCRIKGLQDIRRLYSGFSTLIRN